MTLACYHVQCVQADAGKARESQLCLTVSLSASASYVCACACVFECEGVPLPVPLIAAVNAADLTGWVPRHDMTLACVVSGNIRAVK